MSLFTQPKPPTSMPEHTDEGGLQEILKIVVHALLIAIVFRTFFFQPFNIPSSSMKPTLLIGDYLFVSKFSYGISKYSIPFSPDLFSGRLLATAPQRGDVAVFKLPRDNETDYIKRVIGLPGDTIQMINSVLHINGQPVKRERIADFSETYTNGNTYRSVRYRETLPNGISYETLDETPVGDLDNTPAYRVPEGHYFMMGDNRDNSTDSRVLSSVGFVPFENFVGRADRLFFSVQEGERAYMFWLWPWTLRSDRLFQAVR